MDKVEISGNGEEPTMEDILSSIRKIIAEDKTSEAAALDVEGVPDTADVLELGAIDDDIDIEDALKIPDAVTPSDEVPSDEIELFEDVSEPEAIIDALPGAALEAVDDSSVLDLDTLLSEPENAEPADESEGVLELMEFIEDDIKEAPLDLEDNSLDLEDVRENKFEALPEIEPTIEFEPVTNDSESDLAEPEQAEEASAINDPTIDLEDVVIEDDVQTTNFDESLDLVMDSDASDYLAPTLDAEDVTATSWKDKAVPSTAAALFGSSVLAGVMSGGSDDEDDSVDDAESAADADLEAVAQNEDVVETQTEEYEQEEVDFDVVSDDINTSTNDEISDGEPTSEKDEDLNLVKSLLAGLMDEEPADDEMETAEPELEPDLELVEDLIEAPADEDVVTSDSILDEILDVNVEDEVLLQDEAVEIPEDSEPESELANIARRARAAAEAEAPLELTAQESADVDGTELSERSAAKEFSLLAGVAATAAGIGLSSSLSSEDIPEDEAVLETMSDIKPSIDDEMDIADLVAETEAEISETITPEVILNEMAADNQTNQPQEENPMVRIVKTETLLGDDTEKDTMDAFASLSDVVQEKAELAENGPAIGELVQEALKPMLQEWLDKNLKGIVTRAVTKEIKRISSTK